MESIIGTGIVCAILIVAVSLIIRSMIKNKRRGKSAICGGNCSCCQGNCGKH